MNAIQPQMVAHCNATIGGLRSEHISATPARTSCGVKGGTVDYRDIGLRLEKIREHFSDLSQKDWAEKHGFQRTQWNNWETGARRISVDADEVLCETYGLTLDAIYRGRLDGLSENLRKVF